MGLGLWEFKWLISPVFYRYVAVDNQQFLSGHVELAAQLVRFPVYDPEALVVRVENRFQKL